MPVHSVRPDIAQSMYNKNKKNTTSVTVDGNFQSSITSCLLYSKTKLRRNLLKRLAVIITMNRVQPIHSSSSFRCQKRNTLLFSSAIVESYKRMTPLVIYITHNWCTFFKIFYMRLHRDDCKRLVESQIKAGLSL